jgi:hypothetical protein
MNESGLPGLDCVPNPKEHDLMSPTHNGRTKENSSVFAPDTKGRGTL